MTQQATITGLDELRAKLTALGQTAPNRAGQLVFRLATKVQKNAVDLIQDGKKSGKMGLRNQASAPGEAPAVQTGQLVSSIAIQKVGDGWGIYTAKYGRYLEFGHHQKTKNGDIWVAPRPFLRPAWEKAVAETSIPELQMVWKGLDT